MAEIKDCCKTEESKDGKEKGFFQGVLYGLLPHSFCIAFIVFTVLGSTLAANFFRKALLAPYFFGILIGLSFIFATISGIFYLKRLNALSLEGIKRKKGYLSIMYGTTIVVNVLFFTLIFPLAANVNLNPPTGGAAVLSEKSSLSKTTITVNIPCSGHASLITTELYKNAGIKNVSFSLPNVFGISFDLKETNISEILALEIFKTYPATIK